MEKTGVSPPFAPSGRGVASNRPSLCLVVLRWPFLGVATLEGCIVQWRPSPARAKLWNGKE